jgi:hypothetical protein
VCPDTREVRRLAFQRQILRVLIFNPANRQRSHFAWQKVSKDYRHRFPQTDCPSYCVALMRFLRETFPLVAGITNEICRNIRSREAIKHVTSRLEKCTGQVGQAVRCCGGVSSGGVRISAEVLCCLRIVRSHLCRRERGRVPHLWSRSNSLLTRRALLCRLPH